MTQDRACSVLQTATRMPMVPVAAMCVLMVTSPMVAKPIAVLVLQELIPKAGLLAVHVLQALTRSVMDLPSACRVVVVVNRMVQELVVWLVLMGSSHQTMGLVILVHPTNSHELAPVDVLTADQVTNQTQPKTDVILALLVSILLEAECV